MARAILTTSVLTGVFCAVFALVVDAIFDALPMLAGIAVAFVSGFSGSMIAQLVLGKTGPKE